MGEKALGLAGLGSEAASATSQFLLSFVSCIWK